ncbi:Choline kinase B2 [Caenorhabditis elegans]|uniref:Choline kinase B2 n=1 Tax=Caenorhabditis elegans TaxID=6239 RepID=CKB2_CAEEL|nr:Choline kinase B2 [Caenorhabditis elegans]P46559.2 RecName: Full=Choline kinase B2 [Caenorhabditis elegans]AAN41643.1 choline kinase CKB-2 [Caenorhabditis elegans]CAA84301.2 Choline kinase B2 [Caenorhabditis elegans]|eukprot:NP_497880.2 Choline kinase B2 [Caenorhabditis elegans]
MTAIEKFFTEKSPDSEQVLLKVIELGIDFLGGEWKNVDKSQVNVSRVHGGQSNHMFHVTSSTSATPYLLRIHRQPPSQVFTDTVNLAIFSERGLGPKLYGFFEGGRMEEFLPSKTFDVNDVLVPENSRKIGAIFPLYHSINVPVSKSRRCVHLMREWLNGYESLGGGDYEILPTTVNYSDHPKSVSIKDLNHEIDNFEKWSTEIFEHTLVFSHNDLASTNILELNSTKELVLIDWEFGTYNWRGFDLAMHLSETAIDYRVPFPPGIKMNGDLIDNPPNIQIFCEAYVEADKKLKNRSPSDPTAEVKALIQECQFFWPLTNLFWALSAMKHSLLKFENGVDLDVQARDRLAVYFHLKPRSQKIYEELSKK